MFGGLLSLFAVIDSMPLESVGKIAYVGAIWHIIGITPAVLACSLVMPVNV